MMRNRTRSPRVRTCSPMLSRCSTGEFDPPHVGWPRSRRLLPAGAATISGGGNELPHVWVEGLRGVAALDGLHHANEDLELGQPLGEERRFVPVGAAVGACSIDGSWNC